MQSQDSPKEGIPPLPSVQSLLSNDKLRETWTKEWPEEDIKALLSLLSRRNFTTIINLADGGHILLTPPAFESTVWEDGTINSVLQTWRRTTIPDNKIIVHTIELRTLAGTVSEVKDSVKKGKPEDHGEFELEEESSDDSYHSTEDWEAKDTAYSSSSTIVAPMGGKDHPSPRYNLRSSTTTTTNNKKRTLRHVMKDIEDSTQIAKKPRLTLPRSDSKDSVTEPPTQSQDGSSTNGKEGESSLFHSYV